MPIQIIINGANAEEAILQMADFIGARNALLAVPSTAQAEIDRQAQEGNGADTETVAAEAPKRRGRKPKEQAAEAETQEEVEQQEAGTSIEEAQDGVRTAMTMHYLDRYGREATQADMLKLYKIVFPDGSVTKVTEIPAGRHGDVVKGIIEMSEKNPFKRKDLSL